MNFKNKVVLITGASSGIGASTAEYLAKLGASLALTGRNEINLKQIAGKCKIENVPEPLLIIADVTVEADCVRIIETTVKHYGKIDVLVNSAGIIAIGSIETATLADYDVMMNANVRSVFHLTQLAIPHLVATKGNIVNVSSVTGVRAFPGILPYCISKSAIDQLTRCVALEIAPKGVRVNSVNPGVIVTNLHKSGGMTDEQYQKFLEHAKETHALGRPGESSEVAAAIAFLACDATSSFITGVQLPVDGGRQAMCPR